MGRNPVAPSKKFSAFRFELIQQQLQDERAKRELRGDQLYFPRVHGTDWKKPQIEKDALLEKQRALLQKLPTSTGVYDLGQNIPKEQDHIYQVPQSFAALFPYQGSDSYYLFTIGISPCIGLILQGKSLNSSLGKGLPVILFAHLDSDFFDEKPVTFY